MTESVKNRKYSLDEVKEIGEALGLIQKHDPASLTLGAPTLHGPSIGGTSTTQFGIFSRPGVRPDMFSTFVRPRSLARLLRPERSRYVNENLEVMSGVTAATGSNATGWCGNPPSTGQGKVAQQQYVFGNWYQKTELNAIPNLGQLRNRADVPRDIMNQGPGENPLLPDLMFKLADTESQLQYELWRVGVELERSLEYVLVNGTAGGTDTTNALGWWSMFAGLSGQIATGKTDSVSGTLVPALDSAVISFNAAVNGTIGGGDGRNLVQALHDLIYGLKQRASGMGMDGVQWAIVMRAEAFRAAVEAYVCNYATYRCSGSQYEEINQDAQVVNSLRLEMMSGQYFLVDDMQVPVIFSEGIVQDIIAANNFESDMMVVPISWQGMPLLRLEYFPMDNQYAAEYASFLDGDDTTTLNNGMFIAGVRSAGFCKEYLFGSKMRLILETPWLAGRIDNLQYVFRAPIRNAYPGDTHFYANGGVTYVG